MGTDCSIWVDGEKELSLDRWYVFSDYVQSGKEYSRQKALELINKCLSNIPEWANKECYLHWLMEAAKIVAKLREEQKIIWYADCDEPENFDYFLAKEDRRKIKCPN